MCAAIRTFVIRHFSPPRTFIFSFITLILVGTVLLQLPFSAARGNVRFLDALFTSTSAVCVTGLVVCDIGKDLSLIGQIITLFLFQIGGLGIITFSAFFFGLMGRGISIRETEIIQSAFMNTPRRDFYRVVKFILISTVIVESAGTFVLFIRFQQDFPLGKAFFYALYHAVSAFNNCGFCLFPDSLVRYQGDVLVNLTIMGLIILGGIGFIVHHQIVARIKRRTYRLSLHTKIVLITTGVLLCLGAALFYFFERKYLLKDMPLLSQILVSLFQSVTPRTAGFNTVDIGQLTNATILLMLVLMFVGASPGSTGGGIKTTSAALLFLMIWNRMRGNEEVNVFNRTVPREIMTRTISIILASVFSIFLITSVLLVACGQDTSLIANRRLFVEYLFDTVSAYGTVGLSMGITPTLNDMQKLALVIMMCAGRVGPLTLAFSLSMSSSKKSLTYAEESVMVG